MADKRLLCLSCREVIVVEVGQELAGCPVCRDTSIPADADDTVTLTITKHELRILTMWADNHARAISKQPGLEGMVKVTMGIIDAIGRQTDTPLTLSQEIADARAAFPDLTVTLYRDGRETDD